MARRSRRSETKSSPFQIQEYRNRRRRSARPRSRGTRSRPRKLLFEPLEPRVLLSGDLTFAAIADGALTLRLDPADAGIVEIVETGSENVLASEQLANLDGQSGYAVRIDGAGHDVDLTLDASVLGATEVLDAGGVVFDGGSGVDTLIGADTPADWNVNGQGQGEIDGGKVRFSGIENLKGGTAADAFAFADGAGISGTIDGGGGADTLNYGEYTSGVVVDLASGEATGAAGITAIENVTGGAGADRLAGDAWYNELDGGAGDDILVLGRGGDLLEGGLDSDTLLGDDDADRVWNVTGRDSGYVGGTDFSGIENLSGGSGEDEFALWAGSFLTGTIDGGLGFNTLDLATITAAVQVVLRADGEIAGTVSARNIRKLRGGQGGNQLYGSDDDHDWLIDGVDAGRVGSLEFEGIENLTGGDGADRFAFADGARISGTIDGGDGLDTLDLTSYSTDIAIDLSTGTATGMGGIVGIEEVRGGETSSIPEITTPSSDGEINGPDGLAHIVTESESSNASTQQAASGLLSVAEAREKIEDFVENVTVIVHGLQMGNGADDGDSLMPLARAIQYVAGGGSPSIPPKAWLLDYDVSGEGGLGGFDVNDSKFPNPNLGDPKSELVLLFDWAAESQESSSGWTEAAGDALFSMLVGLGLIEPETYASNQPKFHFIAHSFGCAVASETIERLAQFNVQVDHVTFLDPHDFNEGLTLIPPLDPLPIDEDQAQFTLNLPNGYGATVWNNVTFADTYYQVRNEGNVPFKPEGRPIPGAYNVLMDEELPDHPNYLTAGWATQGLVTDHSSIWKDYYTASVLTDSLTVRDGKLTEDANNDGELSSGEDLDGNGKLSEFWLPGDFTIGQSVSSYFSNTGYDLSRVAHHDELEALSPQDRVDYLEDLRPAMDNFFVDQNHEHTPNWIWDKTNHQINPDLGPAAIQAIETGQWPPQWNPLDLVNGDFEHHGKFLGITPGWSHHGGSGGGWVVPEQLDDGSVNHFLRLGDQEWATATGRWSRTHNSFYRSSSAVALSFDVLDVFFPEGEPGTLKVWSGNEEILSRALTQLRETTYVVELPELPPQIPGVAQTLRFELIPGLEYTPYQVDIDNVQLLSSLDLTHVATGDESLKVRLDPADSGFVEIVHVDTGESLIIGQLPTFEHSSPYTVRIDGAGRDEVEPGDDEEEAEYDVELVLEGVLDAIGLRNGRVVFDGGVSVDGVGGGRDSLEVVGNSTTTHWDVTGVGDGYIDNERLSFIGIEDLTGGAGEDVFRLGVNGKITGQINGGDGENTIVGANKDNNWIIQTFDGWGHIAPSGYNPEVDPDASFVSFKKFIGGNHADHFTRMFGYDGLVGIDLTIDGGAGDNKLVGENYWESSRLEWHMEGPHSGKFVIRSEDDGQTIESGSFRNIQKRKPVTGVRQDFDDVIGGLVDTVGGPQGLFGFDELALASYVPIGPDHVKVTHADGSVSEFEGFAFITGGSGDDRFVINDWWLPESIHGGGGDGSDTLAWLDRDMLCQITGEGSGLVAPAEAGQGTAAVDPFAPNPFGAGSAHSTIGEGDANNVAAVANSAGAGTQFSGFEVLEGGTGDDRFVIADQVTNPVLIDGGGGTNTIDFGAFTTPVIVTMTGQNQIEGTVTASGIHEVVGSQGADGTLYGPDEDTVWVITGLNSGTVGGQAFEGFANLVGGSKDDTFIFEDGGSLSGSIEGGGGDGTDTLDALQLAEAPAEWDVHLDGSGTADSLPLFAGMERLLGFVAETFNAADLQAQLTELGDKAAALGIAMPFFDQSLDDLVGLAAGLDRLVDALGGVLDSDGSTVVLSENLGFGDDDGNVVLSYAGTTQSLTLHATFDQSPETDDVSLTLEEGPLGGLTIDEPGITASVIFDLTAGIDLTDGSVFLENGLGNGAQVDATLDLNVAGITVSEGAGSTYGFLEVGVSGGTAVGNLKFDLDLIDIDPTPTDGRITLGDLNAYAENPSSLVDSSLSGSVTFVLPLTSSWLGIDGSNEPQLTMTFDPAADPQVTWEWQEAGSEDFENFTRITSGSIISQLSQVADWFGKLGSGVLSDYDIPFIDEGLDELFDFGELLRDALLFNDDDGEAKLLDENREPRFETVQEFEIRLNELFPDPDPSSIEDIVQYGDDGILTVALGVLLNRSAYLLEPQLIDLGFDFGEALEPLFDLSTETETETDNKLTLGGSITIGQDFTFGINLGDVVPGAASPVELGTTLASLGIEIDGNVGITASTPVTIDGRLSGDATFRLKVDGQWYEVVVTRAATEGRASVYFNGRDDVEQDVERDGSGWITVRSGYQFAPGEEVTYFNGGDISVGGLVNTRVYKVQAVSTDGDGDQLIRLSELDDTVFLDLADGGSDSTHRLTWNTSESANDYWRDLVGELGELGEITKAFKAATLLNVTGDGTDDRKFERTDTTEDISGRVLAFFDDGAEPNRFELRGLRDVQLQSLDVDSRDPAARELGFQSQDAVAYSLDPRVKVITAARAPRPIVGRLDADVQFDLHINDETDPFTVSVAADDSNRSILDLVRDVNAALDTALEGSAYAGFLVAEAVGDRLVLKATNDVSAAFDGANDVDEGSDWLTVATNQLEIGTVVTYTSDGSGSVGSLVHGKKYKVWAVANVSQDGTQQVQLAELGGSGPLDLSDAVEGSTHGLAWKIDAPVTSFHLEHAGDSDPNAPDHVDLGFEASAESTGNDIVIQLSNAPSAIPISLDAATTVGGVINAIIAATKDPDTGENRIEWKLADGLRFHDLTFDPVTIDTDGEVLDDQNTHVFSIAPLNGSSAGLGLKIIAIDASKPGGKDGWIDGGQLGGVRMTDRLFIQNATLDGSLSLTAGDSQQPGINASARFGFAAIDLHGFGSLTGTLGVSLVNPNDPLNVNAKITLSELIEALNARDLGSMISDPVLSGSAQLNLIAAMSGGLSDLLGGTGTVDILLSNEIDESDVNLLSLAAGEIRVEHDLGGLGNFDFSDIEDFEFGFDNIIEGLRELANILVDFESLGFISSALPILDVSIADLLGYAEEFSAALDDLESAGATTVQELDARLKQAFNLSADSSLFEISIDDTDVSVGSILKFSLNLGQAFDERLDVAFDLGGDYGFLAGAADLRAMGSADFVLDLGIALDSSGSVYLYDSTEISGNLSAAAADLSFRAGVGGFGVMIREGQVGIGGDLGTVDEPRLFAVELENFGKKKLSTFSFDTDATPSLAGTFAATLPVYFPTDDFYKDDIVLTTSVSLDGSDLRDFVWSLVGPDNLADIFDIDLDRLNLLDKLVLAGDGVDLFLQGLQGLLDGEVFGLSIPLIGDRFSRGSEFVGTLREGFAEIRDLMADVADLGPEDAWSAVAGLLEQQFGDSVIDESSPVVGTFESPAQQFLEWDLSFDGELFGAGTSAIDFDLGLPGLALEMNDGALGIDGTWSLAFGFGVSMEDGFYLILDNGDDPNLDIEVEAWAGGEVKGTLGFLQLTAEDNHVADGSGYGPQGQYGTGLELGFGIDFQNGSVIGGKLGFSEIRNLRLDAQVLATANVDLGLTLGISDDLGSAATGFPSLAADFVLDWGLGDDKVDDANDVWCSLTETDFGESLKDGLKTAGFKNVGFDLGSYVSNVLGPVVSKVAEVTEPLQPIIDVLTAPLPVISDLGDPLTLIDLAGMTGYVNPDLIYAIADIITLVNNIAEMIDNDDPIIIIADFKIYDHQDNSYAGFDLGSSRSLATIQDTLFGQDEHGVWNGDLAAFGLGDLSESDILDGQVGAAADILKGRTSKGAGDAAGGWSFPIIEDPMEILGLLLGRPAVLIGYDMAPLEFEFNWSQFFTIFGPLGVSINMEFWVNIDFAFGYDTTGIQQFAESGFRNPLLVLNGLFISDNPSDPTGRGADDPELVLGGNLWAAAELNLGVARGGVGGGITAEIEFDLYDPDSDGRVRLGELASSFMNEWRYGEKALAPLAVFDVHGEIWAELFAFLKVDVILFQIDKTWNLTPPITLLEFDIPFTRPPVLATELPNGDLQLNIGEFARQRINKAEYPTSGVIGETISVKSVGDTKVKVWSEPLGINEDKAQEYDVSGKIIAVGGGLDDTIDLSRVTSSSITFEVDGGGGGDEIKTGTGDAIIKGGAGIDEITGGAGDDVIYGGLDADTIHAGEGRDIVFGGTVDGADVGHERIAVDSDSDSSDDTIYGQGGADFLFGGAGGDTIEGGSGDDLIIGDAGAVTYSGSSLPDINSDAFIVTVQGDNGGDDTLQGGSDDDWIYGVSGVDTIRGGDDDDHLYAGSQDDSGGDTIYGNGGSDTIRGSNAADTIRGGAQNDVIRAGDGNDVVDGGGGKDTIEGGIGDDVLFGKAGKDYILGQEGNDLLSGGSGNDELDGGESKDWIFGGYVYNSPTYPSRLEDLSDAIANREYELTDGVAQGVFELPVGINTTTYGDEFAKEVRKFNDRVRLKGEWFAFTENAFSGELDDDLIHIKDVGSDIVDGQDGSDTYLVAFQGSSQVDETIEVFDSGVSDQDIDSLKVRATDGDDKLFLRASYLDTGLAFVSLVDQNGGVQRLNYRSSLESLTVDGRAGDDIFAVDDTKAVLTLNGGIGDDHFQIGQLYKAPRDLSAGVRAVDIFATVLTTRGFLSNGISEDMTINGGAGDDDFTVFHNEATLALNGGAGDDSFFVKAFAMAGSRAVARPRMDITGGAGADYIEYVINAPVNIDGGDGYDTLVVVGTEFPDDFVVTEDGVYGAGVTVNYVNLEAMTVDGAEGDDRFFVLGSGETFTASIAGGLGSDTFNVGGDAPAITSNDLLGHSGIIEHEVISDDPDYNGVKVVGVSANVADADAPGIRITPSEAKLVLKEGGASRSYSVVLTRKPTVDVTVTALAPVLPEEDLARGQATIKFVDSPVLVFTPETWHMPQEIVFEAVVDDAAEGVFNGRINHTVSTSVPEVTGTIASCGDTTITVADGTQFPDNANVMGRILDVTLEDGRRQTRIIDSRDGDTLTLRGDGWGLDTGVDGTVTSASANTLVDNDATFQSGLPSAPTYQVKITKGTGVGQIRTVASIDSDVQLTLSSDWDVQPESDSEYTILEDARPVSEGDFGITFPGADTVQAEISSWTDTTLTVEDGAFLPNEESLEGLTVTLLSPSGVKQSRVIGVEQDGIMYARVGNTLHLRGDGWIMDPEPGSIFVIKRYDGLVIPTVEFQIHDTGDTAEAGVMVYPTDHTTELREGGGYDEYELSLTRAPRGDGTVVEVNLKSLFGDVEVQRSDGTSIEEDDPIILSATNPFETVRVLAAQDNEAEGFHKGYVEHTVTSEDATTTAATADTFAAIGDGRTSVLLEYDPVVYAEGIVTSASPGKLRIDDTVLGNNNSLVGYLVLITDGAGRGQTREILSHTSNEILIWSETEGGREWSELPDASSTYRIITPVTVKVSSGAAGTARDPLAADRFWIDSNTLVFVDHENGEPELRYGSVRVDYTHEIVGYDGVHADRVRADISDEDAPGVRILESQGSTDIIEIDPEDPALADKTGAPWQDSYQVVLTSRPEDDVTVRVLPRPTPTSLVALPPNVQVKVSTLTLTFTADNWDTPQTVEVEALHDDVVDGGNIKAFASRLHSVGEIQGPLFITGAGGLGSLAGLGTPDLLAGETNVKEFLGNVLTASDSSVSVAWSGEVELYLDADDELDVVDDLVGRSIEITAGTGADQIPPFRMIDAAVRDGASVVLTLNRPWEIVPDDDSQYAITEESFTFFVDETEQVDFLTVYDTDSFASKTGVLEDAWVDLIDDGFDSWIHGLGMAPAEIWLNGRLEPGGITYGGIETSSINLGSGDDRFAVLSASKRDRVLFDGSVSFAISTPTKLTDVAANFKTDVGGLVGYQLRITPDATDPNQAVQTRTITFNTDDCLTLAEPLNVTPGNDYDYEVVEPPFRTWTMLQTGDGDDTVHVSLDQSNDGSFAVDAQAGDDKIFADKNTYVDEYGNSRSFSYSGDAVSESTLPLVVFGGEGDDKIHGGAGDDILFGDRGRVDYFAERKIMTDRTPTSATGNTLTDDKAPFVHGGLAGDWVRVSGPDGTVQTRQIDSNTTSELTVVAPWDGVPNENYSYEVFKDEQGEVATRLGTDPILEYITEQEPDAILSTGTFPFVTETRVGPPAGSIAGWQESASLYDSATLTVDDPVFPTANGGLVGMEVWITDGPGAGQSRLVEGNTATTLILSAPWTIDDDDIEADSLSRFYVAGVPMDQTDGVMRDPGRVLTVNPEHGGVDTIHGRGGSDTILGGAGGDTILGDAQEPTTFDASDILVGDHGALESVFDFADPRPGATLLETIETTYVEYGGADTISGNAGHDVVLGGAVGDTLYGDAGIAGVADGDDVLLGDHGLIRYLDDGDPSTIDWIETREPGLGGADTVSGNAGADVVLGGAAGDTLYGDAATVGTGDGDDVLVGDHGEIVLASGILSDVRTTRPDSGGSDTISGNAGSDIVLGGFEGDTLYGDAAIETLADGDDILLGDNGEILLIGGAVSQIRTMDVSETTGGADTVFGNHGSDVILGGVNLSPDVLEGNEGGDIVLGDNGVLDYATDGDTSTLDSIRTLDVHLGAADTISGNAGDDIVFGGTGGDQVDAGEDDDLVLGDHGEILLSAGILREIETKERTEGGSDTVYGGTGEDMLVGGAAGDLIDGDQDDDLVFGDNVRLDRLTGYGDTTSQRFQTLLGSVTYSRTNLTEEQTGAPVPLANESGQALVGGTPRDNPAGTPVWADWDITVRDHSAGDEIAALNNFGDDYIAGGAANDTIFGQLGDDTIQGDGSIDGLVNGGAGVGAWRNGNGELTVVASFEATTDGDDYIEGNGGDDVIFGNLGQDDIVGGSSNLFSLTTAEQRPDGEDLIFGGAGTDLARNNHGEFDEGDGHARDADMILGDNGNIYRLVGTNGTDSRSFLTFNYDDYSGDLRIIARAAELIDYTPGGLYYTADAASDLGGADEIHGESGDDFIYGMLGGDLLFGEGQDDDLIGGYGHDWISGGAGDDGVLGDDGRIFTSRNDTQAEPLYGIAGFSSGELNQLIRTPGSIQQAIINVEGRLKKTVDLTPFNLTPAHDSNGNSQADNPHDNPDNADDIIYGGLGSDFVHGGAGDDAMSGAEALEEYYDTPSNAGNVLRWGEERTGEFAAYDEYDPRRRIQVDENGVFTTDEGAAEFLLNFHTADHDPANASLNLVEANAEVRPGEFRDVYTDGDDVLFGDLGNDWIVGGTGRDHLYGGWGDDLMNADDDHDSTSETADPRANDVPDTHGSYEDIAYGGAGRDILLGNTGGDRLIDWAGEFNSYLVPFAPFGAFTISRAPQPHLFEYLYDLSESDGADQTRAYDTGGGDASVIARNGEPDGELGLVMQRDPAWRDQTGAPDDPQPGNIPGGRRDVLRSADFNDGHHQGFTPDTGTWEVESGRFSVAPENLGEDAVSVYHVDEVLPGYFELLATINPDKDRAGLDSNAYLIFDYQSPTDFKFAGVNPKINKLQMGHRTAEGWIVDVQNNMQLWQNRDYHMLLAHNGTTATLVVNGTHDLTHVFDPRIDEYGDSHGLNAGMVGIGANNARGRIDDVYVQVLPPEYTLQETEDFSDGSADRFESTPFGDWLVQGERYEGTPRTGEDRAVSLVDLHLENGLEAASILELKTTLSTERAAGVVFDSYGPEDFKFVAIDAANDQVVIGHHTARRGWVADAVVDRAIDASIHDLEITLKGKTVSVTLDGQVLPGHVFNGLVVDGEFGLLARDGAASFASVTLKTDDPAFEGEPTGNTAPTVPEEQVGGSGDVSFASLSAGALGQAAAVHGRVETGLIVDPAGAQATDDDAEETGSTADASHRRGSGRRGATSGLGATWAAEFDDWLVEEEV